MTEGDRVYVEDEHGNKRFGIVRKIDREDPPGILVEWSQSTWFNEEEVKPMSAVDQLGDLP